jgi:hypothetical protein
MFIVLANWVVIGLIVAAFHTITGDFAMTMMSSAVFWYFGLKITAHYLLSIWRHRQQRRQQDQAPPPPLTAANLDCPPPGKRKTSL